MHVSKPFVQEIRNLGSIPAAPPRLVWQISCHGHGSDAMSSEEKHTIVLAQFTEDKNTRTFLDYESVPEALDGICQLYEQSLKA